MLKVRMGHNIVVFDGHCAMCNACARFLRSVDFRGALKFVDYHMIEKVAFIDPRLTPELVQSQLCFIERDGRLSSGFFAIRRIALILPALCLFLPLLYFSGMSVVGPKIYGWISRNRFLLRCKINAPNDSRRGCRAWRGQIARPGNTGNGKARHTTEDSTATSGRTGGRSFPERSANGCRNSCARP
jgi:predicted DCC family thiol-disulfide oxidoreductase YuxK